MTLSVTGLLAKPNLKDKTLGIYGIGQTTRGAVLGLACQIRRLGQPEMVTRQGETDVLFVFAFGTEPGRRLALHIENKLASGRFTAFQPEVYDARARLWCRNPSYGNYDDWETVVLAPRSFLRRHAETAQKFGALVAHEDVAQYLPSFSADA